MDNNIDGTNYGPLATLIGRWSGNKGLDIAPDNQANEDRTDYTDSLIFTVSGPAENAEQQQSPCVRIVVA